MRRKKLGNSIVKKAITIAMALMMLGSTVMTSSVKASAADIETPVVVAAAEDETEEEEATVTVMDVVAAMDQAEVAEKEVVKELWVGDVVAKEIIAVYEEQKAEQDVVNAGLIQENADKKVEKALEAMDSLLDEANESMVEAKDYVVPEPDDNDDDEDIDENENLVENPEILQGEEDIDAGFTMPESNLDNSQRELEEKIEHAEEAVEAGFATSTEASAEYDALKGAYDEASDEYKNAADKLSDANQKLADAQVKYEYAKTVSEEAAEAALAELKEAEAEMDKAVEATKTAKDRVDKIDGLLDSISDRLNEYKENTNKALEEAQEKLDESIKNTEEAFKNLEDAFEDAKEPVEKFKEAAGKLQTAIDDLKGSIDNAKLAQDNLEAMYDAYREALKAYEDAKKVLENYYGGVDENYVNEVKNGDAEKAVDELNKQALALFDVKEAAEAVMKEYNNQASKDYTEAIRAAKDEIAKAIEDNESEEVIREKQDALAEIIIKGEVVNNVVGVDKDGKELSEKFAGCTVVKVDGSEETAEYGSADGTFFAVVDKDGNVVTAYMYQVTENGTIEICEATAPNVDDTVDYNGENYTVVVEDGKKFIEVDNKKVEVLHGENGYYVVEDRSDVIGEKVFKPEKVTVLLDIGGLTTYDVYGSKGNYYYKALGVKYYLNDDCTEVVAKDGLLGKRDLLVKLSATPTGTSHVTYNGADYTVVTEGNNSYILVDGEKMYLDLTGNVYTHNYTEDVALNYNAATQADKVYEIKGATGNTDTSFKDLVDTVDKIYGDAYADYTAKVQEWNNAKNKYEAYVAYLEAKEDFEEVDLGTLAYLPKNIKDMFNVVDIDINNPEDLKKISDNIGTVIAGPKREDGKKVDYTKLSDLDYLVANASLIKEDIEARMAAYNEINSVLGIKVDAAEFIAAYLYEYTSPIDSIISEIEKIPVIGLIAKPAREAIKFIGLDQYMYSTKVKHEYVNAWLDAINTKVKVAEATVNVGLKTVDAGKAGVEVLKAAANIGDASVKAALAKVQEDLMSGAVTALVIAGHTLDLADKVVVAIDKQVEEIQAKTDAAYNAAVAARDALLALEERVEPVKKADLVDAKNAYDAAMANYTALDEQRKTLEDELEKAEGLLDALQKEVDDLKAKEAAVVVPGNGGGNEGGSRPSGTPALPTQPEVPAPIMLAAATPVTPVAAAPAEEVEETEEVTEEVVAEVEIAEEETPLAEEPETVEVAEEETPLASIPEEAKKTVWWWILAVIAAATAGLTTYYVKKKKALEVEAKEPENK